MNGKQLKNSILQLAIQGKLVPQDPNDEPASELLKRIRAEKEQLVKGGKLKKKDLVTTPISDEEKPFEIPESWEWCRLYNVGITNTGTTPSKSNPKFFGDYIPFLGPGDIQNSTITYGKNGLSKLGYEVARPVAANSIIQVCIGGSIGKCAIVDRESTFNQQINSLTALVCCHKYLFYCMQSDFFAKQMIENSTGTATPIINRGSWDLLPIPLPPLSEQHRIVAKIEELMPLVEEYDKAQTKLEDLNRKLPEALKKSILQEAIMGKLVAQDPNDEPASELLKRIRAEKEQLVKDGKLKKKDLVTTPISDEDKPFEIPESWEWCRLGDVGIFERGNGIKRDETRAEGYPCVRYGEMYTAYRKNPTFEKTISFTTKEVFEKCRKAHKDDLFMALTGENKKDIALAAQYVGDEEIAVGGDLCHFTVLEAYALYFVYLINSPYYSSKKELLSTGDIIVHISADKLGSIPFPLPPLAEQKRIVAKIEQLFSQIEGMK